MDLISLHLSTPQASVPASLEVAGLTPAEKLIPLETSKQSLAPAPDGD